MKRRGFQKARDEIHGEARKARVAIYTRVSTEDQAREGFSLDAQIEKLRAYASVKDWTIAGEYQEEGESGRTIKRPAYVRMMGDLQKFDVVLVMKMDRIHRNSRNFLGMMDELRAKEKDFVSLQENLDTSTAMGRFAMDMIQRIAQLESETIGERTFVGMNQKIKSGGGSALGQWSPFGYRWLCKEPHDYTEKEGDDRVTKRCPGRQLHKNGVAGSDLVAFPEESETVKRIFRLAAKGGSVRAISKDLGWCACVPKIEKRRYALTDGTIKIWEGTTLRGDCKGCNQVRYVLTNPTYLGYIVWAGKIFPGTHDPLVDLKTFEAYNRRRAIPVILPGSEGVQTRRQPMKKYAHQQGQKRKTKRGHDLPEVA